MIKTYYGVGGLSNGFARSHGVPMTQSRDINEPVPNFAPPPAPVGTPVSGRYAALEPLSLTHAPDLYRAYAGHDGLWDYMPNGPFVDEAGYVAWVQSVLGSTDPVFYAIRNLDTGRFCGVASFLRIAPEDGAIEVGFITFAPELQGTRAATDAMYLMMSWAFEAGYRRYEWKCNAMNMPSRRAAERLGFSYEGVFRQATLVKGRNRDTAWFASIDREWPALKSALETWLAPANFTAEGRQIQRLSDLTAPILVARDPALL